ncbi:hypothetical protein L2E82_02470 [Cichorium intybus]|uniref:Uncharacterized protein n=1 Tax=Cichorium intybus TaxID=13427 RepID=A0ACB9H1F1_CICIN|nr:hypothetical protein L2E82_02470 [Cichorium intybus]
MVLERIREKTISRIHEEIEATILELKNSKPKKHKNWAILGCCSAGAVRPSLGAQVALVRELCSNLPGLGKGSTGDKPHREVDCLSTSMVRIDPFFLAIETWGITYSD